MKKSLATIISGALALALLAYSGLRSLDLIQMTLPPDRQMYGFFGIAASEIGLLCWLAVYLYASSGGAQKAISLVMIVVDLAGSLMLFASDTLIRSSQGGLISSLTESDIKTILLALSGLVGLNIAATVAMHLCDPANRQAMAIEESRAAVEDASLRLVQENTARLAADTAPALATSILESIRGEFSGAMTRRQLAQRQAVFSKNSEVDLVSPLAGDDHKERK